MIEIGKATEIYYALDPEDEVDFAKIPEEYNELIVKYASKTVNLTEERCKYKGDQSCGNLCTCTGDITYKLEKKIGHAMIDEHIEINGFIWVRFS